MKVLGQKFPCARAEKGTDFVRAYDASGACIFEADKVRDFADYVLTDGVWSEAEPTEKERLEELETLVAALLFGGEGE